MLVVIFDIHTVYPTENRVIFLKNTSFIHFYTHRLYCFHMHQSFCLKPEHFFTASRQVSLNTYAFSYVKKTMVMSYSEPCDYKFSNRQACMNCCSLRIM